jgi:hypothetical protein
MRSLLIVYDRNEITRIFGVYAKKRSRRNLAALIDICEPMIGISVAHYPQFRIAHEDIAQAVRLRMWRAFLRTRPGILDAHLYNGCQYMLMKVREYVYYEICKDEHGISPGSEQDCIDLLRDFMVSHSKAGEDLVSEFETYAAEIGCGYEVAGGWIGTKRHLFRTPAVNSAVRRICEIRAMTEIRQQLEERAVLSAAGTSVTERDLEVRDSIAYSFSVASAHIQSNVAIKSSCLMGRARMLLRRWFEKEYSICSHCWQWRESCRCG